MTDGNPGGGEDKTRAGLLTARIASQALTDGSLHSISLYTQPLANRGHPRGTSDGCVSGETRAGGCGRRGGGGGLVVWQVRSKARLRDSKHPAASAPSCSVITQQPHLIPHSLTGFHPTLTVNICTIWFISGFI